MAAGWITARPVARVTAGLGTALLLTLGSAPPATAGAEQEIAVDDVYDLPDDGPLTVGAPGVRENDNIPADTTGVPGIYMPGMMDPTTGTWLVPPMTYPGIPGYTYTVELLDDPSHGSATLAADGGFTYTPQGAPQDDAFTYRVVRTCTSGDCTTVGTEGVSVDQADVTLDGPAAEGDGGGTDGGSSDGDDGADGGAATTGAEADGADVLSAQTAAEGRASLPATGGSVPFALAALLAGGHLVLRRLRAVSRS